MTARIIPARAGFTGRTSCRRRPAPDHPRSRGVYVMPLSVGVSLIGSSPLARGLPGVGIARLLGDGIIPARAGFTWSDRMLKWSDADHPRSRGVYLLSMNTFTRSLGSSPLARGLPVGAETRRVADRIIPARAGFTPCSGSEATAAGDHPRSRGVYRHLLSAVAPWSGSSPLARGLLYLLVAASFVIRIIPARAGFTRPWGSRSIRVTDHPRSRGVYSRSLVCDWLTVGSSPLARGLPRASMPRNHSGGIIPARAGFTRGRQA